ASLKMCFFRDCGVSDLMLLDNCSCAIVEEQKQATKKSLFLEAPMNITGCV
ncbi:MAG: hypothetical protein ACI9KM_001217, partial [Rubritalea sp.]